MARILVVEDEINLRNTLIEILSRAGYEVYSAGNAASGIERIREREFDLVLLDVYLPDGSGVKVLEATRATTEGVPVLIMSGDTSGRDIQPLLDLGVSGFLEKPTKPGTILKVVIDLLGR